MPSANGHARQQPSNPSIQATKQPSNQATKQVIKNQKKATNNAPKFCKKSTKMVSKIHQVGSKSPPSWSPKFSKISALGRLGGVWGPSWAILDHLGPRMAPRAHKDFQKLIVEPPWTPQVGAQIEQKSIRRPSKKYYFF